MFAAFLADAEIPASLLRGALDLSAGKPDMSRNSICPEILGAEAPLLPNAPGRQVPDVASSDDVLNLGPKMLPSRAAASVSLVTSLPERRSISPGARFLDYRIDQRLFLAPRGFQACEAVMPKDALDSNVQDV